MTSIAIWTSRELQYKKERHLTQFDFTVLPKSLQSTLTNFRQGSSHIHTLTMKICTHVYRRVWLDVDSVEISVQSVQVIKLVIPKVNALSEAIV